MQQMLIIHRIYFPYYALFFNIPEQVPRDSLITSFNTPILYNSL